MMRQIEEPECRRLALAILRPLRGLSIGQAEWVLREAATILESTHVVDPATPAFIAFAKECQRACPGSAGSPQP